MINTNYVLYSMMIHDMKRDILYLLLPVVYDDIYTEQNRTDCLFDVNYTVSSQSNTIIIYIPRSQILLKT